MDGVEIGQVVEIHLARMRWMKVWHHSKLKSLYSIHLARVREVKELVLLRLR